MAEKKTAAAELPDPEELVEYPRPIDMTGRTTDLVVGVNGEMIRIMNGETVHIKRKFLEVIQNSERQRMQALLTMNQAQAAYAKAAANL